jgi:hypothetical protein
VEDDGGFRVAIFFLPVSFPAHSGPVRSLTEMLFLCSCVIESWKRLILRELNAAPQFHDPKRG